MTLTLKNETSASPNMNGSSHVSTTTAATAAAGLEVITDVIFVNCTHQKTKITCPLFSLYYFTLA